MGNSLFDTSTILTKDFIESHSSSQSLQISRANILILTTQSSYFRISYLIEYIFLEILWIGIYKSQSKYDHPSKRCLWCL